MCTLALTNSEAVKKLEQSYPGISASLREIMRENEFKDNGTDFSTISERVWINKSSNFKGSAIYHKLRSGKIWLFVCCVSAWKKKQWLPISFCLAFCLRSLGFSLASFFAPHPKFCLGRIHSNSHKFRTGGRLLELDLASQAIFA
jgi:hypothetical protein